MSQMVPCLKPSVSGVYEHVPGSAAHIACCGRQGGGGQSASVPPPTLSSSSPIDAFEDQPRPHDAGGTCGCKSKKSLWDVVEYDTDATLCEEHEQAYQKVKQTHPRLSRGKWLSQKVYALSIGNIRAKFADVVVKWGVAEEHRERFWEWAQERIEASGFPVITTNQGDVLFINQSESFEEMGWISNDVQAMGALFGRPTDSPVKIGNWMSYEFYNVPREIRDDYEHLIYGSYDEVDSKSLDTKQIFLPMLKKDLTLQQEIWKRNHLGVDLAYEWAKFFKTDDMVEANELRKKHYPQILTPRGATELRKAGIADDDIPEFIDMVSDGWVFPDSRGTIQMLVPELASEFSRNGMSKEMIRKWKWAGQPGGEHLKMFGAYDISGYVRDVVRFGEQIGLSGIEEYAALEQRARQFFNQHTSIRSYGLTLDRVHDAMREMKSMDDTGMPEEWVTEYLKGTLLEGDQEERSYRASSGGTYTSSGGSVIGALKQAFNTP